jgi:hypothetical protein
LDIEKSAIEKRGASREVGTRITHANGGLNHTATVMFEFTYCSALPLLEATFGYNNDAFIPPVTANK